MNQKIIDWTERMRKEHVHQAGRVIDIGSLNVNGTVKHLFSDATEYIGIDFRAGKDVDIVCNAHDLVPDHIYPGSVATVVCMNMLEHDDQFWLTLEQIDAMLIKGGYLYLCIPTFTFPQHDHPRDYWRAGVDAFHDVLLKGFKILNIETVYTKDINGKGINPVLCGLGVKL